MFWKKQPQPTAAVENSRATEQRRMRALDHGDIASNRGAEILVPDVDKKFDPNRSAVGSVRTFGTGGARTKTFNFQQKARTGNFLTRNFFGAKSNLAAEKKFATGEANANGKYEIPNLDEKADLEKTATTKQWWGGKKVAATKDLPDGDRSYLGQERKKMGQRIDPKSLADWRSGGGETVIYNAGSVDRVGNLKQLSIGDVRELLNKNK